MTSDLNEEPQRNQKLKKYLKIIILVVFAVCAYMYYTSAKEIKIPDEAYAMYEESHFKELLETPYKKVIWFGPDCKMSQARKKIIDLVMKKSEFDKYYIHRPFLQNSMAIGPSDKLGHFILQNCNQNMCIVAPQSHKIIQTDEENLIRDLKKYLAK